MSDNIQVNTNGQAEEKLFTQEQVNAIVGKRLAEQKTSLTSELDQREESINKREMAIRAAELLSEAGLDKNLASVLKYDTEDELITAINTISNIRGMKAEQEDSDKSKRRIIENRLPKGENFGDGDNSVRSAFGL